MSTTDASQIHDLRSALDFLREMPGQLLETDTQVDPRCRGLGRLPSRRCWRHRHAPDQRGSGDGLQQRQGL
mgnify:CR=1 FL=1